MKYENTIMFTFIIVIVCLFIIIFILSSELRTKQDMLIKANVKRINCEIDYNNLNTLISETKEEWAFSEDGLRKELTVSPEVRLIK